MKTRTFLFAFLFSSLFAGALPAPRADASVSVSIEVFHRELAPYGSWVTVGRYGTCWRPARVAAGWQPYLDGEWLWTDAGWTWVSYDPWVSYPWHYGTWVYTLEYGWVWIPGTIWAPAWVTWYVSGDYCGWAPVPPSLYVGISGYSGPPVRAATTAYVFVPTAQLAGVDPRTVRAPIAQNTSLAARARPVTRFAASGGVLASGGPALADVERASGRRIPRASVSRAKTAPARVPAALSHGRATVVAPARERARLVAPRPAPAPKNEPRRVQQTTRREPASSLVRPSREAPHAAPQVAPAPRHEAPPRVAPPRAASPPHRETAPPPEPHAERRGPPPRAAAPPHVAPLPAQPRAQGAPPHAPQGPPPQAHGNPPPRERGKEKGD